MYSTLAFISSRVLEGLPEAKQWKLLMSPDETEGFELGTWSMFLSRAGITCEECQASKRISCNNQWYIKVKLTQPMRDRMLDYLNEFERTTYKGREGYIRDDSGWYTEYYEKLKKLIQDPSVFLYFA